MMTAATAITAITAIEIHVEGGGDDAAQRAVIEQGLRVLFEPLEQLAKDNGLKWRIRLHGPRHAAHQAFAIAAKDPRKIAVLLVDAEGPVIGSARSHLARRDGWDLGFAKETQVHLMAPVMEAWPVADPNAVRGFYGPRLMAKRLPKHVNLEKAPKRDIERALKGATENTQKGRYHKINHPGEIMPRIDREVLKSRCPGFRRIFVDVAALIEAAGRGRSRPASSDAVREPDFEYVGEPLQDGTIPPRHDHPSASPVLPGPCDFVGNDRTDAVR